MAIILMLTKGYIYIYSVIYVLFYSFMSANYTADSKHNWLKQYSKVYLFILKILNNHG